MHDAMPPMDQLDSMDVMDSLVKGIVHLVDLSHRSLPSGLWSDSS